MTYLLNLLTQVNFNLDDLLEKGYAVVGIVAIFIHIIVNFDVFFRKGNRTFPGGEFYLFFLISVIVFHTTDALWGVFYSNKANVPLFIDTSLYFVGMGVSLLFWGIFVSKYLATESKLVRPIVFIGYFVFALQMVALIINIWTPILFEITSECEYYARPIRYVTLTIQMVMYLLLIIYTIRTIVINKGKGKTIRRHIALMSFSIAMIIFLNLQVFLPLLPMYSLGLLFGVTMLHTFVLEDQKVERQYELEEARTQVAIDALTGMKSKHAYVDREEQIDKMIAQNVMTPFAIVVFDLNDLKLVNDTYGHEAGDLYIIAATKLISQVFSHSEIYRIGGDEFVAILNNGDYGEREALLKKFNDAIQQNIKKRGVIVSSGMSCYYPGQDNTFVQVFNRADEEMYQRKHEIKDGISKK